MAQTLERYRSAAESFTRKVVREFGKKIDVIVLYGSAATGAATEDSDIDVLIITDDDSIREGIYDIAYDVNLQFDVLLSLFFISRKDFSRLIEIGSPFVEEVIHKGVVLYERDKAFKRAIAEATEAV